MTSFDITTKTIFLCDPDPETIDTAQHTFKHAGVSKFFATPSHREALKQISKLKPDLVLIAMQFSDINGIQLIQKIRSMDDGVFYKTPILIMLSKTSQNLMREACRAGIEGALRKPLAGDKLLRLSRAVMIKPRRFIHVRHYFGPERRTNAPDKFDGEDRRKTLKFPSDATTGTRASATIATRSDAPAVPRGQVLNAPARNRGADAVGQTLNIGGGKSSAKTFAKAKSEFDLLDGVVHQGDKKTRTDFDFGIEEVKKSSRDIDFTSEEIKRPKADYDFTSQERPQVKNEIDFTSQDKIETKPNVDFSSHDKPALKQPDVPTATEKPEAKAADIPAPAPQASAPEQVIEPANKTGPKEDKFEEVVDLEECLEDHKTWVNSGGKLGKQANRPNSDFRGKELEDADFTKSILPRSNFEDVNCKGVVLRKSDLRECTFKNALLNSADLRVCLLRKADMRNARMDNANLLGADLSGADLQGAMMRKVNLSGANLTRTDLRGVNLVSAQGLIPEQVRRAITDKTTRLPF